MQQRALVSFPRALRVALSCVESDRKKQCLTVILLENIFTYERVIASSELSMGWVDPWVGLGWVGLGWVIYSKSTKNLKGLR